MVLLLFITLWYTITYIHTYIHTLLLYNTLQNPQAPMPLFSAGRLGGCCSCMHPARTRTFLLKRRAGRCAVSPSRRGRMKRGTLPLLLAACGGVAGDLPNFTPVSRGDPSAFQTDNLKAFRISGAASSHLIPGVKITCPSHQLPRSKPQSSVLLSRSKTPTMLPRALRIPVQLRHCVSCITRGNS